MPRVQLDAALRAQRVDRRQLQTAPAAPGRNRLDGGCGVQGIQDFGLDLLQKKPKQLSPNNE